MSVGAQVFLGLTIGSFIGEYLVSRSKNRPYDAEDVLRTLFYQGAAMILYAYALR